MIKVIDLFNRGAIPLPLEMIHNIINVGPSSDKKFEQALHEVAYGNLDAAKAMLDKNPRSVSSPPPYAL